MKIEKGSLVVTVNGVETTVLLPVVAANATVKAWSVPVNYRENGLFVAVTIKGQSEEVPACSLSETEFLGELALDAGDAAVLSAAKAAKMNDINAIFNDGVAALAASYPEREVQSWPQQVKEAEAFTVNAKAPVPLLTAIAGARALAVADLAARVLEKMSAYASASGALIGRRQAAEDKIGQATTLDELAAVVW